MKQLSFLILVLAAMAIGCGEPYDPNLGQKVSQADMDAAKGRKAEAQAIYNRAGGVWEKMTPEDKKRLLELSANNEQMAKQGWPLLGKM